MLIRAISSVSFARKKDTSRRIVPNLRLGLKKKGNLISLVCYESNMVHISYNTWWIDSSITIHVANTMQGFLNQRKPTETERSIYSGNWISSHVEAVGTYRLVLRSGFVLNL